MAETAVLVLGIGELRSVIIDVPKATGDTGAVVVVMTMRLGGMDVDTEHCHQDGEDGYADDGVLQISVQDGEDRTQCVHMLTDVEGCQSLPVHMSPEATMLAFRQASTVVGLAGRPPCPPCLLPRSLRSSKPSAAAR